MINDIFEQGRFKYFDDTSKSNLFYCNAINYFPWANFYEIAREFEYARYEFLKSVSNNKVAAQGKDNYSFTFDVDYDSGATNNDKPKLLHCSSKAGRPPFPFWPAYRAFVLARFMRVEDSVLDVYFLLKNNPTFAVACGFVQIPSYRSLARFDQIMTDAGLWKKTRKLIVELNLKEKVFSPEEKLVVDTTHVDAESVPVPKDSDKKPACDNVGVMRKSKTVTHIAHKVSVIGFPGSDMPLMGTVHPGGMPDNLTLEPSLRQFSEEYPSLAKDIDAVLADGIYQTADNHDVVEQVFGEGSRLVAPINPRGHKEKKLTDISGIIKIDKYGCPHCISGYKMILLSRDQKKEQYIWGCPVFHPTRQVEGLFCSEANHAACCNLCNGGRVFRTERSDFPQINWDYPQHSIKFNIEYCQRSSAERINSNLKEGYGFRRVHKRNKKNVEAHVDKCIAAVHLLAYMAHFLKKPDLMRSWSKMVAA